MSFLAHLKLSTTSLRIERIFLREAIEKYKPDGAGCS